MTTPPGASATTTLPWATTGRRVGAITISKGWLVSFSHLVPTTSAEGWCGHNCDVRVELTGPPDPVGMVWDFGALGPAKEVFERVDHQHLDDLLPGLPAPCEDTAQLLADYLGDQLTRTDLPFAHLVGDVSVVDAWPDASSRAWGLVTRPLRFHAAHRLDGLPDGHKCRRQHGHGYQVGVQIDPAATGTPRAALQPADAFIRYELHQRSLNQVLGPNPTAEQLAATLGAHFIDDLQIPGVMSVLVAETPTTLAVWRPAATRP
jgi:6-pyruvoyltetrahydropterin/6-carboxytetrahydropterin synthase